MLEEKKIYIILSDTGTWLTRAIRLYTKAPLNHASIAFDPELSEVYSFGRKRHGNPFIGGFVKEDLRGKLFNGAPCAVYSCNVSEQFYQEVRSIVDEFEKESSLYKYNFLGLFFVMFNIRFKRERAYFCSQFISTLFERAGSRLVPKCPEFTTPSDIGQSTALTLEFRGILRLQDGSAWQDPSTFYDPAAYASR